jgi:hypothetical protein
MDTNSFVVEGRYFDNPLWAFTFAGIQADRMDRPVEVHGDLGEYRVGLQDMPPHLKTRSLNTWHATAHPTGYKRQHLVKEGVPQ